MPGSACGQYGNGAERGLGCGAGPWQKWLLRGRRDRGVDGLAATAIVVGSVTLVDINLRAPPSPLLGLSFATPAQAPSECEAGLFTPVRAVPALRRR